MQRRRFGRKFKIEAVRLIKDRGGRGAPAARDLEVHENVPGLPKRWRPRAAAVMLPLVPRPPPGNVGDLPTQAVGGAEFKGG